MGTLVWEEKEVSGIYYLNKNGFSINEGGTPLNITVRWDGRFFIYVYLFGLRLHN